MSGYVRILQDDISYPTGMKLDVPCIWQEKAMQTASQAEASSCYFGASGASLMTSQAGYAVSGRCQASAGHEVRHCI